MNESENNLAETPELSQPADEQHETQQQPETDQSDDTDSDLDTEGVDPEFEEVEIDGLKVALPKDAAEKARAALLRQADYTRKTQELAETRKQSEAEIANERQRIEIERANIQSVARIVSIDERLQQYANVNWQELSQSDPVRAQQEFFTYQQLKDARQGAVAQIQQHEHQRALQEREATARAMQQANEVLGREIKGWSPEYAKSLREVAKELGADEKDLDGIRAPWIVRALHAQKVLKEMTQKAQKAPPPPPAQPVRTVTGNSAPARVDPDKLSTDEWMKWRNRQVAKSRR